MASECGGGCEAVFGGIAEDTFSSPAKFVANNVEAECVGGVFVR